MAIQEDALRSMSTLEHLPELDKTTLIGGCSRLPLRFDAARLLAEVVALPKSLWGSNAGRVGTQFSAQAVFLRGHAPYEGKFPIEDRDALAHAPYANELIHSLIPAEPMRCLLALLPAGGTVMPHTDNGAYFLRTIRLHFPVITTENVWMVCAGQSYQMREGEIWALNNRVEHAVWNDEPRLARVHLICDFLSSPALLALLERSERNLGGHNSRVNQRLTGTETSA